MISKSLTEALALLPRNQSPIKVVYLVWCLWHMIFIRLFQSSDILYSTYEELSSYYDRKGAGRLHLKSGLRAGFTHKPLGSIESMTVLHSYINICRWFLKGMAISESA